MSAPLSQTAPESLHELLIALSDGELDGEQFARLQQLLLSDPAAQAYYRQYMRLCALLEFERAAAGPEVSVQESEARVQGTEIGDQRSELSSPEPLIAPIIIDTAGPVPSPFFSLPSSVGGWLFSYAAATLIMGAAILGAWAYKVSLNAETAKDQPRPAPRGAEPRPEYVGRITGMTDCHWADPAAAPQTTAIPLGDKYVLDSGLMEIRYDSGARVILEGPCVYEVDSSRGGFLSLGKLTARVETKGEGGRGKAEGTDDQKSEVRNQKSPFPLPPSPFVVRTPTAVVTDLGTEFGVEVGKEGTTTSHVFRGAVNVRTAAGLGRPAEVVLRQDEWTRVEKADGTAAPRLVRHKTAGISALFRRRLAEPPKVLDLLDVVAGGDGTGHRRERGIDPVSGKECPAMTSEHFWRHGDGLYWPVAGRRLVDGVFVPDGRTGPVQLDSAGHTSEAFAGLSGATFGLIWARAAEVKPEQYTKGWHYAVGECRQFMPEGRGLLGLHANTGITFSLDAMRRMYSGVRPARFRATAGVADRLAAVATKPSEPGQTDLWVFVDGQLKFKQTQRHPHAGTFNIDIELGAGDGYLTLVTTDGGDRIDGDEMLLGDPVLDMVPARSGKPAGSDKEERSMNE